MNQKTNKSGNQHIKVFTRVRPRNAQEIRSHIAVECLSNKEVAVRDKGQTKTFAFDKVFGPESKQVDVYKAVVGPLIGEVLQGYNCTVFAYGQTGTGKTFTMVGEKTKNMTGNWENDPLCGIVPRTLDHLFDELKLRAEDFTVRVSFLELYNEELCDLLAPIDNDDAKTLRLFEDTMKKGSVIVSGLEERTVHEKNDVYPILEAGSLRRQTAPTLMNAQSSRSHTIFTITVHVKVTTPEGEELFKTGKLNLVDLAGSENIGRSGAVDARAREAGNINQSLLTLGRVITSLVERTPHVPYRESKLTRILQDSLGGRTKTSIIATVSPALCNLEETLSTFDYAHRARNITNKPEINQKTSKPVLLKNYTDEIERLRRELMASREKHGVYLHNDDYSLMLTQIDGLNKELVNKIQLLKVREDEFAKQEDIMNSLNMNLYETKSDLERKVEILRVKEAALQEREYALKELNKQATVLLKTADEATEDSKRLHDRLDRARMVHSRNQEVVDSFKRRFFANLSGMKASTQTFQARCFSQVDSLRSDTNDVMLACCEHEAGMHEVISKFANDIQHQLPNTTGYLLNQAENTKNALENFVGETNEATESLTRFCDELLSQATEWRESLDSDWEKLADAAEQCLIKQKELREVHEEATTSLKKERCTLFGIPASLTAKNSKVKLQDIEARESAVLQKLDSYREEQNELMKALSALREKENEAVKELQSIKDELKAERDNIEANEKLNLNEELAGIMSYVESHLAALARGSQINQSLVELTEKVVPGIEENQRREREETGRARALCTERLNGISTSCTVLSEKQREEVATLTMAIATVKERNTVLDTILASFLNRTNELSVEEGERLTTDSEKLMLSQRILANMINDYCEETFANIHDRCNELKEQELHRDEKTGSTPQRKEFNYPKRLVAAEHLITKENNENIPPALIEEASE